MGGDAGSATGGVQVTGQGRRLATEVWLDVVVLLVVVVRVVVEVPEVVTVPPPPQVVPFRVNESGTGLEPFQVPENPNWAVPPVLIEPLYEAFPAVTADPLCVRVVFQAWVTVCPAVKVQVSRHALMASPRFVTTTPALKPPGHCEATV